jgi:pyruvate formate lyase activating enzyme
LKTGFIFNIERYSTQDGPGIRTTVFLKGCPLHCLWCHNPESQSNKKEITINAIRCIACGKCFGVCVNGAVISENDQFIFLREKCTACGRCIEVCFSTAREMIGREITTRELLEILERDLIFYDDSGGGITFSGGEPLLQSEFIMEMLIECKKRKIHTAVDTSGFIKQDILLRAAGYTDLFLYDLKIMNDQKHFEYTGVSNNIILDNLKKLSQIHHNIIIRFPVIPGINNDENEIKSIADFLNYTGIKQINILPYHRIGIDKYKRIDKSYKLPHIETPSGDELEKIANYFLKRNINVKVGG